MMAEFNSADREALKVKTFELKCALKREDDANSEIARLRAWEHNYLHLRTLLGVDRGDRTDAELWQATETALRILRTERDAAREALEGLINGATAEFNEKGAGGFALARLSDARSALSRLSSPGAQQRAGEDGG